MQRISLTNHAFEYDDDDPAGMRSGMHRFGKQVGAEQTGSDKIAVWTGNRDDDLIAPRSAGVDYFHGET